MFTMRPYPASFMRGAAWRTVLKVPFWCTAITAS